MSLAMAEDKDEREGAGGEAPSTSERVCVGCRRTAPREELVRFAIADEPPFIAPDPQRKLGGRGASVHPKRGCVIAAVAKGGFARAARKPVSVDASALVDGLARLYEQRSESLLIAAARRKMLAIGTDAVREALRAGTVETLVVASDAEGRRDELEAAAVRLGRRCCVMGTKNSLGRLFGRDEVGVLGILDRRIGDEVVRCTGIISDLTGSGSTAAGRAEAQ